MRAGDAIRDIEAKARTRYLAFHCLSAIESFKNTRFIRDCNSGSMIDNIDRDRITIAAYADRYRRIRRGILQRVIKKLLQRELDQPAVDRYNWHLLVSHDVQRSIINGSLHRTDYFPNDVLQA